MDTLLVLKHYYDRVDSVAKARGTYGAKTSSGHRTASFLLPTSLALEQLIREKTIGVSSPLCDAGSADGRIVALAALFGITSLGVEADKDLADESWHHLSELTQSQLLNSGLTSVSTGDFCSDAPYQRAGFSFESFGTFFNYINGYAGIADKIARQSPIGTVFLLSEPLGDPIPLAGLRYEKSLRFVDTTPLVNPMTEGVELSYQQGKVLPRNVFVHVYRK